MLRGRDARDGGGEGTTNMLEQVLQRRRRGRLYTRGMCHATSRTAVHDSRVSHGLQVRTPVAACASEEVAYSCNLRSRLSGTLAFVPTCHQPIGARKRGLTPFLVVLLPRK